MMQLTTSAAMLQRPMARTRPSLEVVTEVVSAIASFYHKWWRAPRTTDPCQRWLTFLRNHREAIAAMDFFTVPTV